MRKRAFAFMGMMGILSLWSGPSIAQEGPPKGDGGGGKIRLSLPETRPWILRMTPDGLERMAYVEVTNETGRVLTDLKLVLSWEEGSLERDILPVPTSGSWDTFWLPEPGPRRARVILKDKETIVWEQETEIPEYCDDLVVVPLSDPVQLGDLQPLCLRGTNYLPRQFPWPGLWREATEKTFDEEFDLMKDLNMNSFRTFYFFDEDAQLARRDGVLTPGLLRKVHTLLDQADQHHLKVMLCLTGSLPHLEEIDTWRRFLRTAVEPFAYDGRVLMWDLINEPGGSEGPKASPELSHWIQTLYPDLERLAPRHLLTVGLCWQFDQLWDLKVKPPVAQYHNYSGAVAVQEEDKPAVRNVADDLRKILEFVENRPLIIGEFGYATVKDAEREDASEERQLEIYEGVLKGAETARITGVYNWTLFHFVPDWMGPGEQSFGVVRPDNSLKPAGVLLKKTLGEWRDRARAPWEEKP